MIDTKLKIGIIAGRGKLPVEIIQNNATKFDFIVAGLVSEISFELYSNLPIKIEYFVLGKINKIINYFKKYSVKQIIFAGSVNRPEFSSLKVDFQGIQLLSKILLSKFKGDDHILKIIAEFFENQGFEIISYQKFVNFENISYVSEKQPLTVELEDIKLGEKILKALSEFDIGQSIIVYNGQILGIEGPEGTDELIVRCYNLRKSNRGGVLVKVAKAGQDLRFDLPTIGLETINKLHKYSYHGLAYDKNSVIILESQLTLSLINQFKLFIYSI